MASFTFSWNKCVRDSTLESTTRLVLFTLATYMDGNGYAYPGQDTLAKASGLSQRSVGTHIRRAIKAGWISVKQTLRRGKKWTNNTYQATIPPMLKREAPRDNESIPDRTGICGAMGRQLAARSCRTKCRPTLQITFQ